jgi:hypothetical protein
VQPFMSSTDRVRKMAQVDEVPDLSGKVDILSYRPVFKGPYSIVYRGKLKFGSKTVSKLRLLDFQTDSNAFLEVAIKVLNAIQDTALHTIRRVSYNVNLIIETHALPRK